MNEDLSVFSSVGVKEIVQDLCDLLSQRRLVFLLGAGCSSCAGLPLMAELTEIVLEHKKISEDSKALIKKIHESFSGAQYATIEDYMSEIIDLLSIAERRNLRGANQSKVTLVDHQSNASELQTALDEIKIAISSSIGDIEVDVTTHQQFIRAIHNTLQAGKTFRCVDYFILNYDTLVEDALGLECVLFCDGFNGGETGWWDPELFSAENNAARVFKIHGSIDWCHLKGDFLPRRIRSNIKTESERSNVLIFPASTKYQETQRDPFAQMLKHMRQSLRPSEKEEVVLAICGYSFSDSHINIEIENALNQSEDDLTLVAFVGTDEPEGKLREWINDTSISDQIRVYAKKSFIHGNTELKKDIDFSWWKFEVLSRLLGGER